VIHRPAVAGGFGSRVPVPGWQLRSSAPVEGTPFGSTPDGGDSVSLPDYRAEGWCVAPARSTVIGALLANGRLPDVERSTNMRDAVDRRWFEVPWWYRTTFRVPPGGRTTLQLDGVIPKADLYVNGTEVATAELIAGAYPSHALDITHLVHRGTNALALRVLPGNPFEDLSIGWIDWNQWPPDNNMGIWRDVTLHRTGDLRINSVQVTSELSLPALDEASVTVNVDVENLSEEVLPARVVGVVRGPDGLLARFSCEVVIPASARETITAPAVRVGNPRVWWPVGEGEQPLYDVSVGASADAVDGVVSDQHATTFGIRSVESHVEEGGGRRFVVNGRPLQVLAGAYAPDLFLRHDPQRMAAELAYAVDLGLNCLRLEGKLENPEFFEMTDEAGLMVLPGWECCTKWESERQRFGAKWTEHDEAVARRSMAREAVALRNRPSVIAFLIGSDYAPPERIAELYVKELQAARWPLPVVSSAAAEGTEAAGPSGMKMTGPYAWVPPVYWATTDPARGGAVGFNSETAAGNNLPRLVNLRRMLGAEELEALWREPEYKQFHAAAPSAFDDVAIFHAALRERYGEAASLEDFVRKAHLANYEATRAQFEAVRANAFSDAPATGTVYWMFNSAWPSLNWQLHDWYLDPGAGYYGAKKGLEPLHVQYDYASSAVVVVNRTPSAAGPFTVVLTVRDLTGKPTREERHEGVRIGARAAAEVAGAPAGEGATWFLELQLLDGAGATASRNVYWLSAVPDVLDWEQSTWRYTPAAQFADLTALAGLPAARVEATAEPGATVAGAATTRVTLRNDADSATPALGIHASVVSEQGLPLAPVLWSDNDVVLFPGEEATVTAHGPAGAVEVEGFNVVPFRVLVGDA
jgi:exo-1,4-beta-D-glucosaminidase